MENFFKVCVNTVPKGLGTCLKIDYYRRSYYIDGCRVDKAENENLTNVRVLLLAREGKISNVRNVFFLEKYLKSKPKKTEFLKCLSHRQWLSTPNTYAFDVSPLSLFLPPFSPMSVRKLW